jgi:hypothetical protein
LAKPVSVIAVDLFQRLNSVGWWNYLHVYDVAPHPVLLGVAGLIHKCFVNRTTVFTHPLAICLKTKPLVHQPFPSFQLPLLAAGLLYRYAFTHLPNGGVLLSEQLLSPVNDKSS